MKKILLSLMMVVMVAISANAKWSKASSHFTYDRVEVEVFDRRDMIGRSHTNTYGYTNFENRNDCKVTINWKCYGVLKDGKRLVLLNDDSFTLGSKQKRGEVYNYGAGKYTHKDFEKYVVAIEVVKENAKEEPEPEEVAPVANKGKDAVGNVNSKNADKVYKKLDHILNNAEYTQDDYSLAIDWLTYTFQTELAPLYERAWSAADSGNESLVDRELDKISKTGEKWGELCDFVTDADDCGKLNAANHAKFMKLKNLVTSTIN